MKKDRIHIYELESYKQASEEQRNSMRICKIRYFDLEGLPSREVKEILEAFIWERGKTLALSSLATELTTYNNIRKFLIEKNITVLQNADPEKTVRILKGWMLEKGLALSSMKSDMKYDKIVEISKERSRQNTETAIRAIEEMLREGEWITVAQLAKKTKLSRANFYVNKDIRKSLDDARYRQQRMLKINFDSVMEIEDLQEKLRKLNLEMVKLRAENQELQVINRNLQKEI